MERRKLMFISDQAINRKLISHCGWSMQQAEKLRKAMLEQPVPMIVPEVTIQEVYDAVCMLLQERFELDMAFGW